VPVAGASSCARAPAAPPTPPPPVQVAAIYLAPEPFTVENNMLTPTFKLKRPQAKAAYQQQLDDMYAQLGSGPV
jgi:long-subunit acyl-CoA synthetase (AMP-forming)